MEDISQLLENFNTVKLTDETEEIFKPNQTLCQTIKRYQRYLEQIDSWTIEDKDLTFIKTSIQIFLRVSNQNPQPYIYHLQQFIDNALITELQLTNLQ